ncbi:MAG: radical SAM protein, partial [Elusimicrobiota bacterium]
MKRLLIDSFGRRITYLRLSVTDRCNLKCVYCVPAGGAGESRGRALLNDDEIVSLVRCFSDLGVSRVRITGGEPLVRRGLPELLGRVASVAGIEEVSLSTNGLLLGALAA